MKVLLQWARRNPQGWVALDSSEWPSLPNRGPPSQAGGRDNEPGWCVRLCVQGVHFVHDHCAVQNLPGGALRVISWNDDPEDYLSDEFYAQVWTFQPLRPDPALGGALNTDQQVIVYAAPAAMERFSAQGEVVNRELRPWSEFTAPLPSFCRHGVWLPDGLYAEHMDALQPVDWREWAS